MQRALLIGLAVGIFGFATRAAEARSGVFRGPDGMVPPGLREPSDPTPPPPPPPSSGRTRSPIPSPATPMTPPPPPVPTTPPAPPRPPPTPGIPQPTRGTALSFEDWSFWYHHNKDLLEWRPGRIRAEGDTAALHARIRDALATASRPVPRGHQSIQAAALIGLGKVTDREEDVELLQAVLAHPGRQIHVQESAALALGLLRRSEGRRRAFGAALYDRVRDDLFRVLEDESYQVRTRGFAALAIGLLGDQPTDGGAPDHSAARTTARLFAFLGQRHSHQDLDVGTLRAIASQPSESLDDSQRDILRRIAFEGRILETSVPQIPQCQAILALGSVGGTEALSGLQALLREERGAPANLRRSAAIALGRLAPRLEAQERATAIHALFEAVTEQRDTTTRDFALMALAALTRDTGQVDRQLRHSLVGEGLLYVAAYGPPMQRSHAALALGSLLRALPATGRSAWAEVWSDKAAHVLRSGLEKGDPRARSAFAVALGIARDGASAEKLQTLASDRRQDPLLRGYALLGLGLAGSPSRETLALTRYALGERRNEIHRLLSTSALGLMDDHESVEALREEAVEAQSTSVKAEAAAALAKIGSAEAAAALLLLATDPGQDPRTRSIAYAALGRIADGEPTPSLARLTSGLNYRASTDLLNELLSIL